ncbi:TPA: hypothetical protein ACIR6D_004626, partial [Enterobacter kobei]
MNDELRELARAVIEKYHLASLDDILREVPKTMCHVLQESDVFETWPADIVRLKFPEEHWDYYISRYEHFRDEVIRNLTPQDYLREMLGQTQRLPCFCSEMADVSAILYSQIINKPVYSLR